MSQNPELAGNDSGEEVWKLQRGAIVEAIDVHGVCDAAPGDLGVVFEETDFYGDGGGPMVRWVKNGHACNVYPGWVKVIRNG
jgi:hypothetical protein